MNSNALLLYQFLERDLALYCATVCRFIFHVTLYCCVHNFVNIFTHNTQIKYLFSLHIFVKRKAAFCILIHTMWINSQKNEEELSINHNADWHAQVFRNNFTEYSHYTRHSEPTEGNRGKTVTVQSCCLFKLWKHHRKMNIMKS